MIPIAEESSIAQNVLYRQAMRSIMYLMIGSWPDLAYAIGKLSQHCKNPKEEHWIAVNEYCDM